MILDEGTASGTIRHEHPHVIHALMRIKPVDGLAGELHQDGPPFNREGKLEVHRDRIRNAHKHPPKQHAHARVKQVQQPRVLGGVGALVLKLGREAFVPFVNIREQLFETLVGSEDEAARTGGGGGGFSEGNVSPT